MRKGLEPIRPLVGANFGGLMRPAGMAGAAAVVRAAEAAPDALPW
jgi:hypothetical protein